MNEAAEPTADTSPLRKQPAGVKPLYPIGRLRKKASLEAEQFLDQARAVLERANNEAEQIIAQARAQAEQELEQARRRGEAEGAEALLAAASSAREQVQQLHERFNEEVTGAAFRVAREVLEVEFVTRTDQVAKLIGQALDHVRSRMPQRVSVHLHPSDLAMVSGHREALAERLPGSVGLDLVADESLEPRDVVIETELGHYGFGVDSQLAELRRLVEQEGGSAVE